MIDPIAPLRSALNGRYDIDREIGQGGYATVYQTRKKVEPKKKK